MNFFLDSALLGLEYALLAVGVYITFRILNLPDLTVDGSFTFGMAVSTVLCAAAHPFAGLLAGALAGAVAGVVTGFLQTHCKIHPILAGILTMSGLYTVNITVLGGPNVSLLDAPKFFEVLGGKAPAVGLVTVVVVVLVTLFFQTVGGLCIRAAGSNEDMVRASSINTTAVRWAALALANALVALSGAILAQCQGFDDVGAGSGMIVIGLASVIIGEIFAAGEVAFIMQLGALLEERTVAKARAGIERLVHLTPRTARRLDGTAESIIPAEEVRVDDLLRVLPGETIPVDGIIVSGQTAIDQSVMTGESLPVDKGPGDTVSSGTVNQFGAFDMRAVKVGEDSSLQRMIRLVQSADAGKARIVSLADRWATWIVVIALSAAALTWLITGQIIRAVTILVVFCPCALVLATPTAIMAAIGNATRHGFLVREGDALERLAKAKVIAFDKTGTLTYGAPEVAAVESVSEGLSRDEVYRLAASAEQFSEHPLGKAIVSCCKKQARC